MKPTDEQPGSPGDQGEALRDGLDRLGSVLIGAAVAVIPLSLFAAFAIFTSTQPLLPGFDALEGVGRLFGAVAAGAGGMTSAGVLAALGGILKLLCRADGLGVS